MYINKVIIYGNLTRDPELKALPSGSSVTSFSLATNRVYKDAKGARQEAVDYHNIVVFGRQAETSAQYLKKGAGVFIEGRLQTRSWDKDGQKQYRTEVVADRVQFGPKGGVGGGKTQEFGGDEGAEPTPATAGGTKNEIAYPEDEINPDDIPF
ncbi:MAG: single-stranded DNA-binding protein [Minisyncoccia bacterium]